MRALVQRVTEASVSFDGVIRAQIGEGLLVLVCAMQDDDAGRAQALADRIARLRIFRDKAGKMNRAIADTGGEALVVSQFTLAADTSRGNRPGFSAAAAPDLGRALYEAMADRLAAVGIPTQRGVFGADMKVALVNDGPVTIWLES